jgi:signal transduction histidine kinase
VVSNWTWPVVNRGRTPVARWQADDLVATIGNMPATPGRPLLRRVPPAAWAAAIWCCAAAAGLRGYTGLPGMPRGLPALPAWSWPVLAASVALALAGCALLRRWPLPALGLLISGSIALMLATTPTVADYPAWPAWSLLAADVAFGFIASACSLRSVAVAFVMVLSALPVTVYLRSLLGLPATVSHTSISDGWTGWLTLGVMPAIVAGLAGWLVRQSREYARRLTAHAADQAVTAERLRLARELHDMVAHSVGIIALQAGAAARVTDTQPARAREAMLAVEAAGRETLAGLRRMVGVLRAAGQWADDEAARLHPAPGLADVERLAAETTAAGVCVDVRWQGQRRPLPPDIDLSAYRIIQESVTNVVRHAGTRSCQVSVEYREQEIAIEVADRGQGGNPPGTGYGLAGMRERVAMLKGQFSAGPQSGGGFLVSARLPVPEAAGTG